MPIGYDFDVKINGEPFPVQTVDDLIHLHGFITDVLHWFASAPRITQKSSPVIESNRTRIPADLPKTRRPRTPTPIGKRAVDYAVRALREMEEVGIFPEQGATKEQVYNAAIALGWQTTARDVKNAVRVLELMMRQNPDLITIQQGRARLTEQGRQLLLELDKIDKRELSRATSEDLDAAEKVYLQHKTQPTLIQT